MNGALGSVVGAGLGGLSQMGMGWQQAQQQQQPWHQTGFGGNGGSGGSGMLIHANHVSFPGAEKLSFQKSSDNLKKRGTIGIVEHLKDYFKSNRDLIFNMALILLIDHFIFKGVFREKIKALVDSFCVKTHKMIEASHHDVTPNSTTTPTKA